jgi:hypothetical protein
MRTGEACLGSLSTSVVLGVGVVVDVTGNGLPAVTSCRAIPIYTRTTADFHGRLLLWDPHQPNVAE